MNSQLHDKIANIYPEKYSTKPTQYIVCKKEYGLYSKKEAEIIADFLSKNGVRFIYDFFIKESVENSDCKTS